MTDLILFDSSEIHISLRPITLTRPVSEIRVGIQTIREKWSFFFPELEVSYLTESYLSGKYPTLETSDDKLYISSAVCPTSQLVEEIKKMGLDEGLYYNNHLIAYRSNKPIAHYGEIPTFSSTSQSSCTNLTIISSLPHLFLYNGTEITRDFSLITKGRNSQPITDPYTKIYNEQNIFVEEGADIKAAILNAEKGPIYIGKKAIIQEGSILIGPICVHDDSMIAWGSKIRPNTTLGPVCRVGGEVGNSIFLGYSNKAHDGFLGNSVIGEWCNLGANTTNSNLKNDYKEVGLYHYGARDIVPSSELFCGTFMGDYTKAGIMTMFNTGTVVGVSSNIYGGGFQDKFVPSFTWGGKTDGYVPYRFDKAIEVIQATMARRSKTLSFDDIDILTHIHQNNW